MSRSFAAPDALKTRSLAESRSRSRRPSFSILRTFAPLRLCVRFSWRAQPTARTGSFCLREDRTPRMTKTEVPHFTVRGLSPEPFQALFDLSGDELEKRRARRLIADCSPGFRVDRE